MVSSRLHGSHILSFYQILKRSYRLIQNFPISSVSEERLGTRREKPCIHKTRVNGASLFTDMQERICKRLELVVWYEKRS
jgi:hypothetical protein